MTNNTLERQVPEKTPDKLAIIRGIIELVVAVLGLVGLFVPFLSWLHNFYFFGISGLPYTIFVTFFYLLTLACGIVSFNRPYEYIWLNIVLGVLFIASSIHWLISLIRLLILHVHITAVPGLIFAFIILVSAGSALIYLTILIRRGIPQAEKPAEWK